MAAMVAPRNKSRETSREAVAVVRPGSASRRSAEVGCAEAMVIRAGSFQVRLYGIVLLDHSPRHQAALIFRNDDFIRSRIADSIGVTLLPCPSNDFYVGVQRSCSHGDVEVVGVVIDDDTDSTRTFQSRRQENVVPFGIALDDQESILQEFAAQALVGLDQDKRDLEPV